MKCGEEEDIIGYPKTERRIADERKQHRIRPETYP
jgi:hypothetical protein